ncbi:hypothetical protein RUND412_006540 [Rhizina undulata]
MDSYSHSIFNHHRYTSSSSSLPQTPHTMRPKRALPPSKQTPSAMQATKRSGTQLQAPPSKGTPQPSEAVSGHRQKLVRQSLTMRPPPDKTFELFASEDGVQPPMWLLETDAGKEWTAARIQSKRQKKPCEYPLPDPPKTGQDLLNFRGHQGFIWDRAQATEFWKACLIALPTEPAKENEINWIEEGEDRIGTTWFNSLTSVSLELIRRFVIAEVEFNGAYSHDACRFDLRDITASNYSPDEPQIHCPLRRLTDPPPPPPDWSMLEVVASEFHNSSIRELPDPVEFIPGDQPSAEDSLSIYTALDDEIDELKHDGERTEASFQADHKFLLEDSALLRKRVLETEPEDLIHWQKEEQMRRARLAELYKINTTLTNDIDKRRADLAAS